MPTLRYELQVWGAGVQTTTGGPAFTLRTQLGHPGFVVPGQIVRPAQGRAESQSWQCTVVDVGSTFTAKLASTAGRMWLLNRLARLRVAQDSTASTAYQTVATARITDISLRENIAEYQLTLNDERFIERNTELFGKIASPTVAIYPASFLVDWNGYTPWPKTNLLWRQQGAAILGNLRPLQFVGQGTSLQGPIGFSDSGLWRTSFAIAQLIIGDVKSDAPPPSSIQATGAFTFLRYHDLGTGNDYEIATFDYPRTFDRLPQTFVEWWRRGAYTTDPVIITVIDTASALTGSRQGYLYMPNAPASATVPYHIGGASGLHPFVIAKQAYDGTFSSSTGLLPRYNSAALTTLQQNARFGRVYFRIIAPEMEDQFLENRIYGPFNVAPLLDSSGNIAPIALHLPQNVNPSNYPQINSANLRPPHPTFTHPARETVNSLIFLEAGVKPDPSTSFRAADRLLETTATHRRTHDTVQTLGKHELQFRLPIFAQPAAWEAYLPTPPLRVTGSNIADSMSQELFHRFGDGPILTELACLPSVDTSTNGRVDPGDFVRLSLGTFPNPATLTRGSTRFMQVVARHYEPTGPRFTILDAGASLQATSAPTVAIARSSFSSRHAVKVTVTGLVANNSVLVHLSKTSSTGSTAAPAATSTEWYVAKAALNATTSLVFHSGALPARYKIWTRALSARANRIRSAWSAAAGVVLASLPGPTGAVTTSITGGTALTKWTNGSTLYGVGFFLKLSTASGLTSTQLLTKLPQRTTSYTIEGLKPSTKYRWGVRHMDPFGGQSTLLTATFATTAALTVSPKPRRLKVVF